MYEVIDSTQMLQNLKYILQNSFEFQKPCDVLIGVWRELLYANAFLIGSSIFPQVSPGALLHKSPIFGPLIGWGPWREREGY